MPTIEEIIIQARSRTQGLTIFADPYLPLSRLNTLLQPHALKAEAVLIQGTRPGFHIQPEASKAAERTALQSGPDFTPTEKEDLMDAGFTIETHSKTKEIFASRILRETLLSDKGIVESEYLDICKEYLGSGEARFILSLRKNKVISNLNTFPNLLLAIEYAKILENQ